MFLFSSSLHHRDLHSFPTRRSSDLVTLAEIVRRGTLMGNASARAFFRCVARLSGQEQRLTAVARRGFGARRRATDRKSTRLNSSHMSISYAVFCLKKKKKA